MGFFDGSGGPQRTASCVLVHPMSDTVFLAGLVRPLGRRCCLLPFEPRDDICKEGGLWLADCVAGFIGYSCYR